MNFFDSHAHYNDEKFKEDREEVIKETFENGVSHFIISGYNLESSKKAIEIANKYENTYAIIGISPNDAQDANKVEQIEELANKFKKIVGIGEIGLDYYWNRENKEIQKQLFIKQIDLANKLNKPIIIHTRDAIYDTLEILKEKVVIKKGIFHCCPLNRELVKEALNLGYYISLSGVITFKNAKNANEIINMIPEDRLLIETDSPYLSPEPLRGKRNTCINVRYVAEKIANVKGKMIEEIAEITNQNAKKVFEIK